MRTTPCEHTFHCECLDSWWRSKASCPICRRRFEQGQLEQQINLAILRTLAEAGVQIAYPQRVLRQG